MSNPKPLAVAQIPKAVTFSVSIVIDMADFATWKPDRITAVFRGISEVLSAGKKADR